MRNVQLVYSLVMALTASLFGVGCGGGATPDGKPAASSPSRVLGLSWLPAETEAVVHVKVADLWRAPLLKGFVESQQAVDFVKELQANTGLTPTDIESATIGAPDLEAIQSTAMTRAIGLAGETPKGIVAVIRTTKPVTLEELVKSKDLKSAEHKSKKYLESSDGEFGVWVAEANTVLIASVADLTAAMDRGETVSPRKELAFMDATSHLVIVAAPKDPKLLGKGLSAPPPADAPIEFAAMQETLAESLAAFGLGINIRGGIDLQSQLMLANAEGAGKVKAGFDAAVTKAKGDLEAGKEAAPPLVVELAEILLNNVKTETQSQVVKFSTSVPDSAQQKLEQVPPLLMGMVLGGGFNPGADRENAVVPRKSGRRATGRKPGAGGVGSTTGGGIELPGTTEQPATTPKGTAQPKPGDDK